MPLLTEKPPKGFEKVLDASVAELVGHGALSMAGRARPAVSAPVRVFHLGADAVAAGKGLAAAYPAGWLTTLTTNGEVRGTIELVPANRLARARRRLTACASAASRPDRCNGDWPRRSTPQ